MAITVAEMVERAVKSGASKEAKEALVQRVRHWTRERLLSPVGKRNPGIGRHRRYADTAWREASILDALTTMGLPIATMRWVISTIRSRPSAKEQPVELHWWEEIERGRNVYLEIVGTPEAGQVNFNYDPKHFTISEGLAERAIILNLTRLFTSTAASSSSDAVPPGRLRMTQKKLASGQTVNEFTGDPKAWMRKTGGTKNG